MEASMEYMRKHICEAASTMKPKLKDFEFDFDWERKNFMALDHQATTRKKNDLSDIQWNFSNLDRSDRIHMVFTTLQDNFGSNP